MKYIKNSYRHHTKLLNTIFIIMSVGITIGFIVALSLDKELINEIYDYFNNFLINYNKNILSNIFYPIIVYTLTFILSLTIIGYFTPFLALLIENMSIGLILGVLIKIKALKGLLFGSMYFLLTKFIYILILIYLIINLHRFICNIIVSLKNKNINIVDLYSNIIIKFLASVIIITMYNLICIFLVPTIINLLN